MARVVGGQDPAADGRHRRKGSRRSAQESEADVRVDFPRQVDEEFEHAVEATVRKRGAVREDLVAVPATGELW